MKLEKIKMRVTLEMMGVDYQEQEEVHPDHGLQTMCSAVLPCGVILGCSYVAASDGTYDNHARSAARRAIKEGVKAYYDQALTDLLT